MSIASEAPRGGFTDTLAGELRTFCLRNAEIERFEDKHRGVFALWDGFFGSGPSPTASEVKDLLALGLIGAGMKPADANGIVTALRPEHLLESYQIAQAILGAAFMPDAASDDGEEDDDEKKEPAPAS